MSAKEKEQLQAELSILKELRHPNIVAYIDRVHLKSSHDLHVYMEYCGNGDLGQVIKKLKSKRQYADEEFVWSIFSQIVCALYRCHYGDDPPEAGKNVMGLGNDAIPNRDKQKNLMILHRDLKPENGKVAKFGRQAVANPEQCFSARTTRSSSATLDFPRSCSRMTLPRPTSVRRTICLQRFACQKSILCIRTSGH